MPEFKRMILLSVTTMMCVSSTFAIKTEANTENIQSIQQELNQTAKEKQSVNKEIAKIQQEMESLNNFIAENKTKMANAQRRIEELNLLIEKYKEEIVVLEDKIYNRKEVMKNRLKALQNDEHNFNIVIKVLIESKSLDDFIQRASAVNALLDADNDILEAQKQDLKRIEEYKKEIDKQQQILNEEKQTLAKQQEELNKNLQARQENLTVLQAKYSEIAEQEAGIAAQLKAAQEKIRAEQAAAAAATANQSVKQVAPTGNGKEMYVSATAYSPEESGPTTRLGYNIHQNPNLKIIAVDPTVIPLGSRVWVEGYGEAIAGDTGSAIKGYKIDVLMPSKAAALSWGRKTVKVVILN